MLTEQFTKSTDGITKNNQSLAEITNSTQLLVSDSGSLKRLINKLKKVIIDDNKFEKISNKLLNTIDMLEKNTTSFDCITNKLNDWVKNQMNFSDSVEHLLLRLESIDKIKDINEVFWENTKKQKNEAVNILNQASQLLANYLDELNQTYQE